MNKSLMRAAKMLAGVRMLRCAMMLALLVATATEVRAEDLKITCSNCGETNVFSEVTHPRGVERYTSNYFWIHRATCIEDGIIIYNCRKCNNVITEFYPALGHDWSEWQDAGTPTCTTPGGQYHTCNRCHTTEYEQPALGHNMSWTTVAATCTTGGYEHGHCQRSGCDYEETRNQTPALGHDFALNHNCTRCDAVDPAKQPTGCLDNCAGGELQISLNGWAYDPNAPSTPIDMHVYVYQSDGTTRYGDIHIINANLQRPDLATALSIPTNHGYSTTIPIADAGTYKVKVYAIDLNGDGNPQIGATQTITVMGAPISLADNANNNTTISINNSIVTNVTLSGRTLYKDGAWNTLCLPFDVNTTSGTLAGDGVTAMTLNTATSGVSGSTLTLNFNAAPATIPAGTPFIIKWNNTGTTIEEPTFQCVTISSATNNANSSDGKVTFKGTFSPVAITANDQSVLFLGAENKLYYPTANMNINSCRAYFQLNTPTAVKEFKLNFDEDEETPLLSPKGEDIDASPRRGLEGVIYDLSGRKMVNGKWSKAKGLYIVNGKKILK